MPSAPSPPPFVRDSRGNRLLRWQAQPITQGHILWLSGPSEVFDQVRAIATAYAPLPVHADGRRLGWTHALQAPGPVAGHTVTMLDTLMTVLSIPPPSSRIEFVLALDWYKDVNSSEDPYQWSNTEVGELVHLGKYRYRNRPAEQAEAGIALVDRICAVVERHVALSRATVVIDVPGHDSQQVSFGSRLAASVAQRRQIPTIRTQSNTSFRPPAKSADWFVRHESIANQFTIIEDLREHSVLIVDDVFRSGTSIEEAARAARAAGAKTVSGIVATRTMRSR